MERETFSIIFYVKRTKILKNNKYPIYCRLTINSIRKEFATKRVVDSGVIKMDAETSVYLKVIENRLHECRRILLRQDKPVGIKNLMRLYNQNISIIKDRVKESSPITRSNKWTKEEDNILINEVKNYPTNLSHAFEEASDRIALFNNTPSRRHIERTYKSVQFRWYHTLKRSTSVNAITCGSDRGFTKNVKNKPRDEEGNLPDQGLRHHLYLIREILSLPVKQREAIVTLLTSN